MPFNFPPIDHVKLKNAPLEEVIFQIRFPSILKIAQDMPVQFQERIRGRFPQYPIVHPEQGELIEEEEGSKLIERMPVHKFLSRDEASRVSLGFNFCALSTTKYESWKDFKNDIMFVVDSAVSVYEIPYAYRVGLRYTDHLTTENTNSESFKDVLDILQPPLTAIYGTEVIGVPNVGITQVNADQEDGNFTFISGIIQHEDYIFLLDFDRYIEKEVSLEQAQLVERLDRYHDELYSAFRWCIKKDKLSIFEPEED